MRLVDPNLPYKIVYSIYHHEYLGYLISPHIVQILPDGQLSLIHQGIYPDNMDEFSPGLDEKDKDLIVLLAEISTKCIVKKFNGNLREPQKFFLQKFKGEVQKMALQYIQRRLAKILPLLSDRSVFEMGNDGYAAQKPIQILDEKATVLFHFRRGEHELRYFPTIKLHGEKLDFQYKGAVMICKEPAWMLLNGELFTFEQEVEGVKLNPFLKKRYISIPKEKEEAYLKKFVTQVIEKYHVYAKGFDIHTVRSKPHFSLIVQDSGNTFSFIRNVSYSEYSFPLEPWQPVKVVMKSSGENYDFFRIERNHEAEERVHAYFDTIVPNPSTLSPWELIPKDKGLTWLATQKDSLEEFGIEILQDNPEYTINLETPEISLETQEAGDWFDIRAIVKIGQFSIPFSKFRKHILRHIREYVLPDKTVAILPETWFSDYRHLLEVSESPGEDRLRIKKYQAPLLNFPSQGNGKLREKLASLQDVEEIPSVEVPKGLKASLRNYQHTGFEWLCFLKQQGMGGILADDMGLGKTLQTLTLLLKEKEEGATSASLIILPTSLIYNWKGEAKKFTPSLKIHIHAGVGRSKEAKSFEAHDLIITSYGIARQDMELLKGYPFHYIILDESQMIKNPESKTAQAIRKLVAKHRLSLTGTPIENTVMDIWSQMSFLNPGLLGSETFFRKFYVSPIEKEQDKVKSAKLRRIIYPFILRRKKEQVEKQLPPKTEKIHYCEMTEIQKDLYEETRSSYRNYLLDLINQGTWKRNKLNILAGLQKLRQIAIHPQMLDLEAHTLEDSGKYLEVKRLLKQILNRKSKVLIFSQFVKMLQILRKDLEEEGIQFNYLDGSTKDRQSLVDSFQQNEDIRVFLISLKAGGVGLNLTAADYVFILDPWWNPAAENQAVDRSHRIGQKRAVIYYKFITKDSIEEKILGLQQRKAKL
ncbi:MAG: DEAD/DEAH box helicase [Bacteroidota bacterium]